nr:GTP binding protein [Polyrhizophydium stewartii]
MYEIGVADNGSLVGLSPADMDASLATLRSMGAALRADMSIVRQRSLENGRSVAEVLFRKGPSDDQHFLEIRVAILGGVDAGKSTLLGVLTHSETDNGRGKSRLNLLRHRHEIETGRTSSVSHQIIGFDAHGDLINYASTNISSWDQICENSAKIVTFLDMCGHPKYQKTTISGLTGTAPDYSCLIVSANAGGLSDVTREHLGISVILSMPIFVVLTKIDIASAEQLTWTIQALLAQLQSPGVCKIPLVIQNEDDLVACVSDFVSSRIVPIFLTSSVTGDNLDLLTKFFNILPRPPRNFERLLEDETEYQIEEVYSVPGTGTVVGGIVVSGRMHLSGGQPITCYLGPDRGRYIPVRVHSLQRQRCPVKHIQAGQAATCALLFPPTGPSLPSSASPLLAPTRPQTSDSAGSGSASPARLSSPPMLAATPIAVPSRRSADRDAPIDMSELSVNASDVVSIPSSAWLESPQDGFRLRRGQVLVTTASPHALPDSYWEFEADLHVLYHSSQVTPGTQGTIYCGSLRQGARVLWIAPGSPVITPQDPRLRVPSEPASPAMDPSQAYSVSPVSLDPLSLVDASAPATWAEPRQSESRRQSLLNAPPAMAVSASMPNSGTHASRRSSSMALTAAGRNRERGNTTDEEAWTEDELAAGSVPLRASHSASSTGSRRKRRSTTSASGLHSGSASPLSSSPGVHTDGTGSFRSSTSLAAVGAAGVPSLTLSTGDRGRVRFRFIAEPEWLAVGRTVLFRGTDRMKCVGKIVSVSRRHTGAASMQAALAQLQQVRFDTGVSSPATSPPGRDMGSR